MSHARNWISSTICRDPFGVQLFKVSDEVVDSLLILMKLLPIIVLIITILNAFDYS